MRRTQVVVSWAGRRRAFWARALAAFDWRAVNPVRGRPVPLKITDGNKKQNIPGEQRTGRKRRAQCKQHAVNSGGKEGTDAGTE